MKYVQEVARFYRRISRSSAGSDEYLAYRSLLENPSFRISQHDARKPLVALRVLYTTAKRYFSEDQSVNVIDDGQPSIAILDSYSKKQSFVADYVNRHSDEKAGLYLTKEALLNKVNRKYRSLLYLVLWSLPLIVTSLLNKNRRGNRALVIHFVAEVAALIEFCEREKITKIYEYSPYLIDSNFQYLLLHKHGIEVTKIPSPGPLGTHHHTLLADRVVLSNPYHREEVDSGELNVRVDNYAYWPPEGAYGYIDLYAPEVPETTTNTVGFYSHASWLREKEGHADNGIRIGESEVWVLQCLADLLRKNPEIHLKIFAHPRERKPSELERTKAYYTNFFKDLDNWEFGEEGVSSTSSFHHVDLGISAISTIIYDRLFSGFKMLVGVKHHTIFPRTSSSLHNITFFDEAQFESMVKRALNQTTDAFFSSNKIEDYRWQKYDLQLPKQEANNRI
jgi:hypothetical protein